LDGCLFHDRALELRLNVIAFYLRCAHFLFTAPALQNWAEYAVQEYDYLVTNDLHVALGLSGFDATIASFTDVTADRLKWNENVKLLADKSETHSISIFQGRIYDSASRFVLSKTKEALDWCCGYFGFETHLCLYQLEYQERKERKDKPPKKKKARRTPPI
jgi:hypothetical protein